ncbi:MAG: hypothetical protein ACFNLD_01720 [Kingella oralis]
MNGVFVSQRRYALQAASVGFQAADRMSGGLGQPEKRIIASRAHTLCFGGQSGQQQAGIRVEARVWAYAPLGRRNGQRQPENAPMCPYGENIGATSRKISIMIANTGF